MGAGGLHEHGETTAHPGADDPQAPRGRKLLNEGNNIDEVSKHLEVSAPTWHRWVAQYGGMKGEDAKRLRELEKQNQRLKKIVADQALDIDMLKELARGNF